MILLKENIKDQSYTITHKPTGIIVGTFVRVDGFYYFSENKNRSWGLWSEEFLVALVDQLVKLNEELNQSIVEYFRNCATKNSNGT